MHPLYAEAKSLFHYTQKMRRDLHMFPELGFQEVRTSGVVARELREQNLEVKTGVAETGVVALIEGARAGPVILVRFDMDALPIHEETGADYASQNIGVMHACGHDGHTAIGLTVARILQSHMKDLNGTVKLVFQPAEEGMGGAERMVAEGVLRDPKPDITLALHLWNERPVGWIGISGGPTMAAAEIFRIRLTGKGGHGAVPDLTVDPIVAASSIVTGLQSIVSRNVSPLKTAVVSVCSIHGGAAFNVIPSFAELTGTIRTFEPEVRDVVLDRFEHLVNGIAQSYGCSAEIELQSITPAVINNPEIAVDVLNSTVSIFPDKEIQQDFRTMGSEDMAFMMQEIPGCYFFIGSANPEMGLNFPHHHPRFDIDEEALPIAAAVMAGSILNILK